MYFFNRKLFSGTVTKKSGDKTVSVIYSYHRKHSKYKKIMKFTRKYLVHDKNNQCDIGNKIYFYYYRPISSKKHYIFLKKIT